MNSKADWYTSYIEAHFERVESFFKKNTHSLLIHTSLRSSYLRGDWLLTCFILKLDFVESFGDEEALKNIEDNGDFNSSNSSSLVCDFLTIDDLFLLRWYLLPTSPTKLAMEDGVGGEYTMGPAMHGKLFTTSFPSSMSFCSKFQTKLRKIHIAHQTAKHQHFKISNEKSI